IDAQRVCVYGASYGGYAALMLAAREPDLFKCSVGYAGVYDLHTMFSKKSSILDTQSKAYYRHTLGENDASLDAISPVTLAQQIKVPVMLVHGEQDERVPVENADKMNKALIAAGHPPELYMRVPNEGH